MRYTLYAVPAAALAIGLSAGISTSIEAGEAEDALIARIVEAYGGDRLTSLSTVILEDERENAFPGQGYTTQLVEFTPQKGITQIDFENDRGTQENWSWSDGQGFHNRAIFDGEGSFQINYRSGTYQAGTLANLYAAVGSAVRITDVLLAREVSNRAEGAEHLGETIYLNHPHEVIRFTMPASPPVTLYINMDTGLISKMTRDNPLGLLTYRFSDYRQSGGLTYAAGMEFYVGPDLNIMTVARNISFNVDLPDAIFAPDSGIEEEGERVDVSQIFVQEIAEGVHQVGSGFAYSTFVDAGDYLIGVGGYAGLEDRLDTYREETENQDPLRYQVVTHHHTDHLGGMAEARQLGATFVVSPNAVDNLRTAAGLDLPYEDMIVVEEGRTSLGAGENRVELYDVSTSHVGHYQLFHLPEKGILFTADHFGSPYVEDTPAASLNGVTLKAAIDELGLNVETLIDAHTAPPRSWAEFESAVAAYDDRPCVFERAICAGALTMD